MADPASIANSRVRRPSPELWTAEILDDATERGQLIRCVIRAKDPLAAEDPMPWMPYTIEGEGTWFPKKGDAALVATPADGPPWILAFTPAPDAVPDVLASP